MVDLSMDQQGTHSLIQEIAYDNRNLHLKQSVASLCFIDEYSLLFYETCIFKKRIITRLNYVYIHSKLPFILSRNFKCMDDEAF